MFVTAEIGRRALQPRRDNVPSGSSPAELVERGELARQVERLGVTNREGTNKLNHESSSGRLLMEALGIALSAYLVHKYSAVEIRQPPARNTDKPLDARRPARVVEFIRGNLDAELTVTQMASVACMSAAHFARSFRLATGPRRTSLSAFNALPSRKCACSAKTIRFPTSPWRRVSRHKRTLPEPFARRWELRRQNFEPRRHIPPLRPTAMQVSLCEGQGSYSA